MKYWIIENGNPIGPFTKEELKVRRDFTADLPVWCSELTDWTTVGQLPELSCLLEPVEEETHAADMNYTDTGQLPAEEAATQPQAAGQSMFGAPATPWIVTAQPEKIDGVERPKSYMGWNIIMLLCCCLPGGVAGLIFGSQVNRNWMRGDVKGALKASEYAQWCIILSIVIGLVAWPFQAIFSLL